MRLPWRIAICTFLPYVLVAKEPSYYEVLGIDRKADTAAIKKAYRKEAMRWHPDKNPDNKEEAEKKFREVAEAYEVLSDPDTRKRYDNCGKDCIKGGGGGGGGGGGDPFGGFGFGGFHFKDANDVFKDFFGDKDPFADFDSMFENVFEESFGEAPKASSGKKKKKGGDPFDMFGGFGGGGFASSSSTFSFSSSSFSGGGAGSFVKTETVIKDGKKVTKTVKSDGKGGTEAMIEETEGGRTKRKTGRKNAIDL
mmetsp:Transcript_43210/g.78609  ORF Transcript_43210/g.78609 Transcript_43210/m.78609 type:complete len:252 (+) Transcript_43210:73-828(+)